MTLNFSNWEGILIEPLRFNEHDKKFLKELKNEFEKDIIILNETKGRGGKIYYQWIKINVSVNGLKALLKIIKYYGEYLTIYKINHHIKSNFPKTFLELLVLYNNISEGDLNYMLEDLIKNE